MTEKNIPFLSVRGLSMKYGSLEVVKDVDLDISKGEVLVVIGPSGSGKSSLIRCLNGLETPFAGNINFDGHDYPVSDKKKLSQLRQQIGMVFQDYTLFPHMTVLRNMMLVPKLKKMGTEDEIRDRSLALLDRVQLRLKADAYPRELSGGQQQRIAIVRALVLQPKIMLFDEPTSALDPETVGEVLSVMQDLASQGMTMVVVTHEMGFARQVASNIVFMEEGRVLAKSDPKTFFESPGHPRLKQFLDKILY